MRIITFSQYDSPSSPLFKSLQVIKFYDLVTFHIATFMYKFHNQLLPTAFHSFFTKVTNIHKYNTRLAAKQSYYLPFFRTNYGKFNIRFQGPSIWNCIDKDIKLSSKAMFKKNIQAQYPKKILASSQFNIFKTVLLYLPIHYCFYIPPIILNLLYFNVLVYCYFYFLVFCDIYVCVCVSDLNYPKQIVRLAACPF